MNKIIALLGLGMICNYALACGGGGEIFLAAFLILGLLQIIITLIDYKFTGKSIKGTLLLTALFFLGILLFNILMSFMDNLDHVEDGIYIIVFIFSLYVFPFITKTIIVKKFKDTFKRKDITTNNEIVVQENENMVIEEQKQ